MSEPKTPTSQETKPAREIDEQTQKHIDRFLEGYEAWNKWANEMLAKKEELERAGKWKVVQGHDDQNRYRTLSADLRYPEIQVWLDEAFVDFSKLIFKSEKSFNLIVDGEDEDGENDQYVKSISFSGSSIDFSNFIFPADAYFREIKFQLQVNFGEARFIGEADFFSAEFQDKVVFLSSEFKGGANFGKAIFQKGGNFQDIKFQSDAYFWQAKFLDEVDFRRGKFLGKVNFNWGKFLGQVCFRDVQFQEHADFHGAQFQMGTDFRGVEFQMGGDFQGAGFEDWADFRWVKFQIGANFGEVRFLGEADFFGVEFKGEAIFSGSVFKGIANFWEAKFQAMASFWKVIFTGQVNFWEAEFLGKADFRDTEFLLDATFSKVKLQGEATFRGSRFQGGGDFIETEFKAGADFREAKFQSRVTFCKTKFRGEVDFGRTELQGEADFGLVDFERHVSFAEAKFRKQANFEAILVKRAFSLADAEFTTDIPNYTQANFEESPRLDHIEVLPALTYKVSEYAIEPPKFLAISPLKCLRYWWNLQFLSFVYRSIVRLQQKIFYLIKYYWLKYFYGHLIYRLAYNPIKHTIALNLHHWDKFSNSRRNPNEEAHYRALKRLAIQAHDHENEMKFFAGEIRARRHTTDFMWPWKKGFTSSMRYWAGVAYELFSDFGRCLIRPIAYWCITFVIFANLTLSGAGLEDETKCHNSQLTPKEAAYTIGLKNSLLILGLTKTNIVKQAELCLYGKNKNVEVASNPKPYDPKIKRTYQAKSTKVEATKTDIPFKAAVQGIAHSLLSLLFIFLLLLAIRNQFKIK